MPYSPSETTAEPIDPVYAIEVLRAMAEDDDPTEGGAALNWREARKLIPVVCDAMKSALAETVC